MTRGRVGAIAGTPGGAGPDAIVCFGPVGGVVPASVAVVAAGRALRVVRASPPEDLGVVAGPSRPAAVVLDGAVGAARVRGLCRALKSEPATCTIPAVILAQRAEDVLAGLKAGADDVLGPSMGEEERRLRLDAALGRSLRDLSVHPATRLPGAEGIRRHVAGRIASGEAFALCHADLDRFKEFNDRRGYDEGDRAIVLLASVLLDVVRSTAPGGFVGHVGGDDFVFVVSEARAAACCDEVCRVFGERSPGLSLSIGVAVQGPRRFSGPSHASEAAAAAKRRAKAVLGTAWATSPVLRDRRPRPGPSSTPAHPAPDTADDVHAAAAATGGRAFVYL